MPQELKSFSCINALKLLLCWIFILKTGVKSLHHFNRLFHNVFACRYKARLTDVLFMDYSIISLFVSLRRFTVKLTTVVKTVS